MTWVKLDDGFADHPKIERLSADAFRAFVHSLCYSSRHLTDGHIPDAALQRIARRSAVRELEGCGLWERNGDGIVIHDYLEFQPSSAQIRQRRAADSARKRNGFQEES